MVPMRVSTNTFIEQQGISLIVTDNGVAGNQAIAMAQAMGVDVIVTDHHSMLEVLPMPMRSFIRSIQMRIIPFHYLAGCGVV